MSSTPPRSDVSVLAVSTGHRATDHRIFDKEARTLARAGFRVAVLAAHPEPERIDGIEVVPLQSSTSRLDRFLLRPWRALRTIRRRRADVVHIHDAELLLICPVLKLLGTPAIVYDVHEDFANLMMHRDWIPRRLRPVVRALVAAGERLLARSVDGIAAATQPLADRFDRHPSVALYNLPTQRLVERAGAGAPPPSERATDVLHLGVLSSERLGFLADTLGLLLADRPATRIQIVGVPADQRERILDRVGAPGLDVIGRVPHDEVAGLLQQARVGVNVHPYLHPHIQVAVPVKVFEYIAAGCAVVTSWLPELDNLLGAQPAAGIAVIREPEPSAYASAIRAWLDDPDRLDRVSQDLHETVRERHSWDSQGYKLVDLYDGLLAGRTSP